MKNYFSPIDIDAMHLPVQDDINTIYSKMDIYKSEDHFPELEDVRLVMFGVPEDRVAVRNKGCAQAPSRIRMKFYPLALPNDEVKIADLGDLIPGQTVEDTYSALITVASELLERGKALMVLGGGQDLTKALYQAYAKISKVINITAIDSRFDLGSGKELTSRNYLNHIVCDQPNYLFNFTNVGYQTYFVGHAYEKLMDELRFHACRLGVVQNDILSAEPLLRNADLLTVDMGSVRQSDAPGNGDPSPHGFYGEQLCQLMRFGGMSDKTSSVLFSEVNPIYDHDNQTSHLVAHAMWFFVEGFYARKADFPYIDKQHYIRYAVQLENYGEIMFYRSKKSERWWMEMPCNDPERRERYGQHLLIPCNHSDYERAMQNDFPEIWWRYFRWLNE